MQNWNKTIALPLIWETGMTFPRTMIYSSTTLLIAHGFNWIFSHDLDSVTLDVISIRLLRLDKLEREYEYTNDRQRWNNMDFNNQAIVLLCQVN